MDLLVLYFFLAVSISFVCSILESVLLSMNMSYISVLEKDRPTIGALLRGHKNNLNVSIASILILNTIANTLGAAGVGAQAEAVFGGEAIFYVSIVLTFAILFISEIIPKTIGALYWKQLAPIAAYAIRFFIFITYPIIILTLFVTNRISKDSDGMNSLTKQELIENTLLSEDEGVIDEKESDVIENVLQLNDIKVNEILTPRSVVFAIEESTPISEALKNKDIFHFSRIPVFKESIDNVTGIVLTKQLFRQALEDDKVSINSIKKDIFKINENIPVSKVLDKFIKKKEHMFLVIDNYDQTEGIVTLEDCVETILGVEIMDESDSVEDMRVLAKQLMKNKRKRQEKLQKDRDEK
jgi:CBS domain containing-hemolysin-like protein